MAEGDGNSVDLVKISTV